MQLADNLTGVWDGRFTYPRALEPVSFQAVLAEAADGFTGEITEAHARPDGSALVVGAAVDGRRDGARLEFVKRYDGAGGWSHAVHYSGQLQDDGREIEGTWSVPGAWSGWFLMIRAGGMEEEVAREAEAGA